MKDDRSEYRRMPIEFWTKSRPYKEIPDEVKEKYIVPIQFVRLKSGKILGIGINDDPQKYLDEEE